jgi:UDP-2,3-diacylglucosamine pyrophosphatase LpxH
MPTKYTIVSDFHIGSEVCQRDKIIHLLKTIKTETLIINGDLIDVNNTKRLKKKDWEILSLLRKMSKNTHIIYIAGNHDGEVAKMISELLGFKFKNDFDFEVSGSRFHITHGHKFDTFISKFPITTEIASAIYHWIQCLSPKKQALARALKRQSKGFIQCCDKIRKNAETYSKSKGYDYIVCSHTHMAFLEEGNPYINTGCFTEAECHYLEIYDDGLILLNKI